jgi:hypothetical protein
MLPLPRQANKGHRGAALFLYTVRGLWDRAPALQAWGPLPEVFADARARPVRMTG